MKTEIEKSLEVLKNSGVLVYPTDTIWGIGGDATDEAVAEKIFSIKQRDQSKSMIVLVANDAMLIRYVKTIPEIAWDLIDVSDKPLTIIYPKAQNLAKNIIADDQSIAIRMVKEGFAGELIKRFNKPIISTSANVSGAPAPKSFSDIDQAILNQVDYVVNLPAEKNKHAVPSSIVKVGTDGQIAIIRK